MSRQLEIELKRSKYRLLGLVGQGQFGSVFCAMQRQTGQLVALKMLEQQRFPTHKFLRELRFLLSLQHPNIVTCQALEHTSTGRCLVMDYCEGGTLRSLMLEENHLSLPQSIKLVADILSGLEHAHSHDIVHCDIKPENILLNVKPGGWIARISDFGVARLSQELSNQEFGNTGSPAYMAPERFYGQYSLTSDLYAVGILLFELMVGQRPFSGTPAHLMAAHLNQPVKIPDTVPEVWRPLIITALQKLSARRFRTAGEMLRMLRSIATTSGLGAALDPAPISLPLFQSSATSPPSPFQAQHQEKFRQPATALAVQSLHSSLELPPHPFMLYSAEDHQVTLCKHEIGAIEQITEQTKSTVSQASAPSSKETWSFSYTSSVKALLPRPQGCFVATQRSLHLIPSANPPDADNPNRQLISYPILELAQNYRVAIDDRGRWLATLTAGANAQHSTLTIRQFAGDGLGSCSTAIDIESQFTKTTQMVGLDAHHFAIVFDGLAERQGKPGGSLIRVLARRGIQAGVLHLPVQIGPLILTPSPYQLLAVDRNNPDALVLIDLKPYRILRLGVDIEPSFLLATTWGYVVANAQGEIVCLDREIRPVGRLLAPEPITAMAIVESYGLLVSTWNGQQGCLHTLDLRQSNLEILF